MPAHRSLARRGTILTALAVGTVVALAGCSSSSTADSTGTAASGSASTEKVTLKFWSGVPDMQKSVDLWNSIHPNIQVEYDPSGGDQTKIPPAVDAGTGPDVAGITSHSMPDYVISGRALDITDYVKDSKDKYTAGSWNSVTFQDRVYGIPQAPGPVVMYVRSDFFTDHNIPVPTTWEEYAAAAEQVRAADPNAYIGALNPNFGAWWQQLVVQSGSSWYGINNDSWKISVDSPESQQLASYWQKLIDQDLLYTDQAFTPEYWADIAAGKIVTIPQAAWFAQLLVTNVPTLAGKWEAVQLPTVAGSTASSDSGGSADIVLKGTQHPKEAAEFADWLNSDAASVDNLIANGGLYPASKIGLDSSALDNLGAGYFTGTPLPEVFKTAAQNAPTTWTEGPQFTQVYDYVQDGLGQVANKEITLSQMITQIQDKTVDLLTQQGLQVTTD